MVSPTDINKAEILIEALPYIRRFNRKTIVVKYGGSAMIDEERQQEVIEDLVLLKLVGFNPILVHGGGREISKWSEKVDLETEFVQGLRVTDEDTMELAEMVLAKVNQDLVTRVQSMGINAVGISGKDGGLLKVKKKVSDVDLGLVGEVVSVQPGILSSLIKEDYLPIVFPVGMDDEEDTTYNVNADEAAGAIAMALQAEKLVFLSDVEGVRRDRQDPESVIAELYPSEADELIRDGVITGGMIPKLNNCISAINNGVNRVHILDGRIPHSLILEIFTDRGCGTAVVREGDEKFLNRKIEPKNHQKRTY